MLNIGRRGEVWRGTVAPKPKAQAFVKCYARVRRGEARDRRGGFGWGLLDWMGQVICYIVAGDFWAGLG